MTFQWFGGTRIPAGLDHGPLIDTAESDYIARRRTAVGRPDPAGVPPAPPIGLALSGGGIRSATFSLGALRSLSRLGLIHRFDYLSTVSGGGYTGAFYASLFTPADLRGANTSPLHPLNTRPDPLGTDIGQAGIRHLRESGRYLLPGGTGDAVRLATISIRGWLAIQLVIGMSLLAFFLCLRVMQALVLHSPWLKRAELWMVEGGFMAWLWPAQWMQGYPLGRTLVLSWFWPFVVMALLIVAALGWAFWLARQDNVPERLWQRLLGPSWLGAIGVAAACLLPPRGPGALDTILLLTGVLAIAAAVAYVLAELCDMAFRARQHGGPTARMPREEEDRVRTRLTDWMTTWVLISLMLAVVALVETIGQTIYSLSFTVEGRGVTLPLAGGAAIVGAIPLLRRVLGWVQSMGKAGDLARRFGRLIAIAAALLLSLAILAFWATVAEYLAWRGGAIGSLDEVSRWAVWQRPATWAFGAGASGEAGLRLLTMGSIAAIFVATAISIGLSFGFLNLSSFSAFYASRLRRAYLGASNVGRTLEGLSADHEDAGDDISLHDYYAPGSGAPLHLLNVTINETRGKGSSLVQRDRKGRPMTLSPAGYIVPTDREERVLIPYHGSGVPGQSRTDLPLSLWVAVSGAAFSTALGSNTSLGFSLLAGLSNLRLGYWWTPLASTRWLIGRPMQWVQRYLVTEFFARFSGIAATRWYLTDGGHFENSGVYELARRRVPLIVACDNGADPDYYFEDIVNLTRKLRIDFDTDLNFLPRAQLDLLLGARSAPRAIFGELSELVRVSKDQSSRGPYAAIARIRAPAKPGRPAYLGTLILLKPRLSGLEMADLLDYHRTNRDFPQQATSDQFFDEAQWESYYRLGITIADHVFAPPPVTPGRRGDPVWSPASLRPIDTATFPWFAEEWSREPQGRQAPPDPSAPEQTVTPITGLIRAALSGLMPRRERGISGRAGI
ncbi:patatin-like phospholipase family protein [Sphingomonas solaris]|nr:patatin-like phospholipase family protein [Sphingomonas solaris]